MRELNLSYVPIKLTSTTFRVSLSRRRTGACPEYSPVMRPMARRLSLDDTRWMGGNVPLGYDANERTLVINPAEAETVRRIFALYRELREVAGQLIDPTAKNAVLELADSFEGLARAAAAWSANEHVPEILARAPTGFDGQDVTLAHGSSVCKLGCVTWRSGTGGSNLASRSGQSATNRDVGNLGPSQSRNDRLHLVS
jgi:hypothetical protein